MDQRKNNILFVALAGGIFIYILYRAAFLSFTHDESISYTIANGDPLWFLSANNHLLNTLGMFVSKAIFGKSELSLRLPNILAFVIYAYGIYKILQLSKNMRLQVFGMVILLADPFMLEFFSLARGYGLSVGFMTLSIYYLLKSLDGKNDKASLLQFHKAIGLGILSMFSNLIMVNFVITILILYPFAKLISKTATAKELLSRKHIVTYILTVLAICFSVIFLLQLNKGQHLFAGIPNLLDAFSNLINDTIYSESNTGSLIMSILVILVSIFSLVIVLFKKVKSNYLSIILLINIILILGFWIENKLFGVGYPPSRSMIVFVPLFSLLAFFLIDSLLHLNYLPKTYGQILTAILSIGLIFNFISGINLDRTTTWSYDATTKEAMQLVREYTLENPGHYSISNEVGLMPSINYYIDRYKLNLTKSDRNGINEESDFIFTKTKVDEQLFTLLKEFHRTGTKLYSRQ